MTQLSLGKIRLHIYSNHLIDKVTLSFSVSVVFFFKG